MGELFRARNTRTLRPVALKLLRPDAKSRADAVERFRREARAAGMINSDHVTQVLDILEDQTHGIAIIFELLEGENLLDYLRRTGPMDLPTIDPIVEQMLRGLVDAHAVGIIHRDLKPSNVFLEQRPNGPSRVKILDFGISKLPKSMARSTLTEPHQALGSFMFMPPEQIQRAANVDHRADIYALGTLVFQSMTGHLPYSSRSMVELVQLKTSVDARTLEQASGKRFPPALQAWISRCLQRDREARFQTANEALVAWRTLVAGNDDEAATVMMNPVNQGLIPPRPTPAPTTPARPEPPYGTVPYAPPPTPAPSAPVHLLGQTLPLPGNQNPARNPGVYGAMPAPPHAPFVSSPFGPSSAPPVAPVVARKKGNVPWLILLAVSLVLGAFGIGAAVVYALYSRG